MEPNPVYKRLPYLLKSDIDESYKKLVEQEADKVADKKLKEYEERKNKEYEVRFQALQNEFNQKVELRASEMVDNPPVHSKIAKMIEEIKRRKAEATPIPLVSPDQVMHKHIECDTCKSDGHVHMMEYVGNGVVKCTGPECGHEKVLVDKDADYRCKTCGLPIKKASDLSIASKQSCQWCGGKKAEKFDWAKKISQIRQSM